MKEFIVKLEEWFQPVEDFIMNNYDKIKIGFWILVVFLIFFNIIKNTVERGK